jgi:hypothetical protein
MHGAPASTLLAGALSSCGGTPGGRRQAGSRGGGGGKEDAETGSSPRPLFVPPAALFLRGDGGALEALISTLAIFIVRRGAGSTDDPHQRHSLAIVPRSSESPARAHSYRSRSGGCCARTDIHHLRHDPASPKKRGCRPLAGSILSSKDLWHPARSIRSASGHHDHDHPVSRPLPAPYVRERCAATSGRGADGDRREARGPW